MKIKYDSDADAMYISLKRDKVSRTKEIDRNTIIDFNSKGQVIGVEILFVKERNPTILKELKFENLISA
ncbi:MAG TPA: DUF2283 domain-containing protein [Candidatus Nanoarchaeia archaeon]|nr:DUF2283 domain-containing protein [Candidatus Nanoarchaeia archaeon]